MTKKSLESSIPWIKAIQRIEGGRDIPLSFYPEVLYLDAEDKIIGVSCEGESVEVYPTELNENYQYLTVKENGDYGRTSLNLRR